MATHSSILAWKNPMDRGAWRLSPWIHKESDMNEHTWTSTVESILIVRKRNTNVACYMVLDISFFVFLFFNRKDI